MAQGPLLKLGSVGSLLDASKVNNNVTTDNTNHKDLDNMLRYKQAMFKKIYLTIKDMRYLPFNCSGWA